MRAIQKLFGTLLLLIIVAGCAPQEETWQVNYLIVNVGQKDATYRVSYLDAKGATIAQGPIDTVWWKSQVFEVVPTGTYMKLTLEILSGESNFEFYIQRDGATHRQINFEALSTSATIDAEI